MRAPGLQLRVFLLLLCAAIAALLIHATLVYWPLPQVLHWLADVPAALSAQTPAPAGNDIANSEPEIWSAPAPWSLAALGLTFAILLPLLWAMAVQALAPLTRLLRALEGAVLSYQDGDFSMAIAAPPATEKQGDALADLMRLHSALGLALREQRQQLAQRELLLDTVVQNTPLAMVLVDGAGRVAYANTTARQLLAKGRSLTGTTLDVLLAQAPAELAAALYSQQDQLFTISDSAGDENFHLSQRTLQLQGRPHRLILLRRMTRELARQEVASWKRVIRVISHELNNSLAPISSLAHSGAELVRRGDLQRLPGVLASIGERASHLHGFLSGYASFAKLPTPRREPVIWANMLERLAAHCQFAVLSPLPVDSGLLDAPQIEQALINLIKNAHEGGSPPEEVNLRVQAQGNEWSIQVADRGPGMSDAVLSQALLPFYSTKRSGTGLGLALAREIVEAHGGRITLSNREGGGLCVTLLLPQ